MSRLLPLPLRLKLSLLGVMPAVYGYTMRFENRYAAASLFIIAGMLFVAAAVIPEWKKCGAT